jgi:hypothetical protein
MSSDAALEAQLVVTSTQGSVVRGIQTADRKSVVNHIAPMQPGVFLKTMVADISVVRGESGRIIGLGKRLGLGVRQMG